ncbi:hypothetical protein BGZ65_005047 [Modicella reniformis]|uniref:NAD(P)-binding domain-containing protein n=1 Tax=Modicella reniformis TaxID=1440133 RepID=A0A9P6SQA5_9FUNG|nr:hypothetical protein BGZ65_005047 [Modicella reniformis]
MATETNRKIALTNADSWLGCCTAYHLAQKLEEKCEELELVCLARKPELLDKLKKFKNVRIEKVDYDDEKTLDKVLRGVTCVLLIPENDENRVQCAKSILTTMKNAQIKSCMMISVEGAGEASHLKELQSYREIEKEVEQYQCYLILRKSILNQCFLLWTHVVREQAKFPISTSKQSELAPIDMCDLVCAIETLVVEHCRHGEIIVAPSSTQQQPEGNGDQQTEAQDLEGFGSHKNKTYTLTGPQQVTPERIAQDLSEITGKQIEVKEVDREELKRYFESLRERENWSEDIDADWCQRLLDNALITGTNDDHNGEHDGDHIAPNEAAINLFLDELELVGKGGAGFVSGDLEKIIGHPGRSIKDFLQKEKDAFKPHRD